MTNINKTLIEGLVTEEFYSPYKLSKLESTLRGKVIPPQKLYGYVRNGYIKSTKSTTDKIQISKEESIKYLTKQVKN